MGKVTIFREYSLMLSLLKWRVYANGKLMAKVGKCSMVTFSLPKGNYELYLNFPDFPIAFRKKGLHSNVIHLNIEDGQEYFFNVGPHPLFATKEHYPGMNRLFTPVECLLLLRQDNNFDENRNRLKQIGKQLQDELKHFKYHPVSLVLIIAISCFAMMSNIRHPDLYATGDGVAWGFLFGLSNLIGLFSGRMNKQMMATGWEYKILLYTAFGALMILIFSPPAYYWQRILYCFSVLITCFWAYFCFRRWKEQKKGLDKIGQRELKLEEGF